MTLLEGRLGDDSRYFLFPHERFIVLRPVLVIIWGHIIFRGCLALVSFVVPYNDILIRWRWTPLG